MQKNVAEIEDDMRALVQKHHNPDFLYHNLEHTETVVRHCVEIAPAYDLPAQEKFELLAAAWFHDTGHLLGNIDNHEQRALN